MIEVYLENSTEIWILCVVYFSLFYLIARKHIINIGDPIWFCILSSSTGCAVMQVMALQSGVGWYTILAIISNIAFFMPMMVFKRCVSQDIDTHYLNDVESITKFVVLLGLISAATSLTFSAQIVLAGFESDSRLLIASNNRILDVISRTSVAYYFFCCGVFWPIIVKEYPKSTFILLFVIGISLINNGSKGALLNSLFVYLLGAGVTNRLSISKKVTILCVIAAFFSVCITIIINGIEIVDESFGLSAFESIIFRILAQGESYYYLMLRDGLETVFGAYNILDYVLHPLFKLFGGMGYEYPLGVLLQSLETGNLESASGPNASLPILAMSFFNGGGVIVLLFMFLLGFMIVWLRNYSIKSYRERNNPIKFVGKLFLTFYVLPIFFLDFGVAIQFVAGLIFIETFLRGAMWLSNV